jgi:hypothetical protein
VTEVVRMHVPWSAPTRLVERRRVFVLVSGAQLVACLPRRPPAPGDVDLFRRLALDGSTRSREAVEA